MATLNEIELKTKQFADERAKLAEVVTALNDGIEALKRQHMPALKRAVARTAQHHDELINMISQNQELFARPRSVVFHGVKVGMQKQKGKISYIDAQSVVNLIRKHYSKKECDAMIIVDEKPIKKVLDGLSVSDLKKIGCTVSADSDEAFIKPTDSDVDKMVTALLKDAVEA